jgi:2-oxoglutarate dehydrogenase E2 component (dihydrolipoamide succinyltransferase)
MGVSVAEGTIVAWHKQPGDWVEADETIAEVTTDKIDTEIPAPASGRLTEILVEPGVTVEVGTPLARIATDARPGEAHATEVAAAPAPEPQPAQVAPRPGGGRRYSPVVQRIAAEHGIDLEQVRGTGRDGRVRKQDVLALVDRAPAAPEPPLHTESPYRPDDDVPAAQPLSRIRRAIGEHMKRSLDTAATCTTWIEVDMSRVERLRAELGVTALPIVGRAVVETLREHPVLNAWLEGDMQTLHREVHLGIAVSLGEDGLIVPVIRSAQDLSVEGLAARIRDVARRARAGELTPDEVRGGTFTITNPGQYGSIMATPVINQPQVAILDLEAVVKRPVVVTGADGADAIAIRPMTILGLSWDHRALDGALAAQFLASLKARLEAV